MKYLKPLDGTWFFVGPLARHFHTWVGAMDESDPAVVVRGPAWFRYQAGELTIRRAVSVDEGRPN